VTLLDDGLHGEARPVTAFSAPSSRCGLHTRADGALYITASDDLGRSSRWPLLKIRLGSPEYLGDGHRQLGGDQFAADMEWFAQDTTAARGDVGTRARFFSKRDFTTTFGHRRRGAATTNGQVRFQSRFQMFHRRRIE